MFVVEENHGACVHACTIEDIRHVLTNIPLTDWEGLDTFVLRQPTRKQRLLRPVWGRMFYCADLGLPGRRAIRLGPAIMLEAVDCSAKFKWLSALDPDDQAELERLKNDGHRINREGHHFTFTMTPTAVRATQLYRTLLHEIGHWVDYLEKVERPAKAGAGQYEELSEAYFRRPNQEREAFAHRYADATRERLMKFGVLPFDPITSAKPGIW